MPWRERFGGSAARFREGGRWVSPEAVGYGHYSPRGRTGVTNLGAGLDATRPNRFVGIRAKTRRCGPRPPPRIEWRRP